mgnify:CR=1 FL=1
MTTQDISLTELFTVAQQAITKHQQEINELDGYNANHGDNMAENMQMIVNALGQRRDAPPATALTQASRMLEEKGHGGTSQYYAKGLAKAAQQLEGRRTLQTSDAVSLVQSLLSAIPSEGHPEEPQPGATVLDQVLGMSQPQAGQGAKKGSPLGGFLKSVVPAALAYFNAKQSGADTAAAASQALVRALTGAQSVDPLQSGAPRTAAGGLVAQSVLAALRGRH